MKINVGLVNCTLCCFQFSSQLMLELLTILLTINTWIIIKKMFLNMIIPTKQKIYNQVKQINIENRTYYFYNDMINFKNVESSLLKIDRKSDKNIGIYNIGYITIKKLMIMKVFIV